MRRTTANRGVLTGAGKTAAAALALLLTAQLMTGTVFAKVVKSGNRAEAARSATSQETAPETASSQEVSAPTAAHIVESPGASEGTAGTVQPADASAAQTETVSATLPAETAPAETASSAEVQPAAEGEVHVSEPRVVTTTLFGGGELMMLAPDSASQMMSFLITTKSGKLIMVDGGTEHEAAHLKEVLRRKGGVVTAWLVTHPHSDHVGAMTEILKEGAASGITVENVYYNFAPIEWYFANEEYRAQMVQDCMTALGSLSPSANHPNIQKGDVINVDDVRITVMNNPYLFQTNAINNSSVAFRVELNGKRILFLGDMGVPAGNSFLNEYRNQLGELKADIVEMAHHGEQGVDEKVYQAIQPSICLWCCPGWLWDNDNGGGVNSGPWKTLEVRGWMRALNVKTHVIEKDGDQVLR